MTGGATKWWREVTPWRLSKILHFVLKHNCRQWKRRQQVMEKGEVHWQSKMETND